MKPLSEEQVLTEFENIFGPATSKLGRLKNHQELVAADARVADFRQRVKDVDNKLNSFYEPYRESAPTPEGPTLRENIEKVLTGADVGALVVTTPVAEKEKLAERRKILQGALDAETREREQTARRLNAAGYEKFQTDFIEAIIKPQLRAFLQIESVLQQKEIAGRGLALLGYRKEHRPDGWSLSPYEEFLLYGGRQFGICFAGLRPAIELLCKNFGLNETELKDNQNGK